MQPRLETDILAIAKLLLRLQHTEAAAGTLDREVPALRLFVASLTSTGCLKQIPAGPRFCRQECEKLLLGSYCGQSLKILFVDQNSFNLSSVICQIHCGQNSDCIITLCLTTVCVVPLAVSSVRVDLRAAVFAGTYMGLPKTEVTCDAKKQCVRRFYKQTLLHTHTPSHPESFTQRRFYTQTLVHTDAFTHRHFYTNTFTRRDCYTQKLLHTDAFTHRSFYTEKLLHTDAFTHKHFHTQMLLHTNTFTHRDRAREIAILLQFCAIEPHFVRKRSDWTREIAILPSFGDRTLFRAKRLRRIPQNRNLHPFLTSNVHFVRTGWGGHPKIALLLQFLTSNVHFVRKCCGGLTIESQVYFSFWRSNLISCERVAREPGKSQFYPSFWRSNLISCEKVAVGRQKSQFYFSFGDRTSFRATRLRRRLEIAILPQFFGDWTSLRAKGLRFVPCLWHCPAPSREK